MEASDIFGILLLAVIALVAFVADKMIEGKNGIGEIKKVISGITDNIDKFIRWINRH